MSNATQTGTQPSSMATAEHCTAGCTTSTRDDSVCELCVAARRVARAAAWALVQETRKSVKVHTRKCACGYSYKYATYVKCAKHA